MLRPAPVTTATRPSSSFVPCGIDFPSHIPEWDEIGASFAFPGQAARQRGAEPGSRFVAAAKKPGSRLGAPASPAILSFEPDLVPAGAAVRPWRCRQIGKCCQNQYPLLESGGHH